jgi:prophage endopeptidase
MPLTFLLRVAPYAALLIVLGLTGTYLHHKGFAEGSAEVQATFDKHLLQDQQALEAANAAERVKEQKHAQDIAEADQRRQEAIQNVKDEYEKLIAGMRADAIRVRNNRAAVCAGIPASATAASASSSDAGATSQLSDADAQFLLHIGEQADEVVEQLSSCQAILKAERLD